MGGKYDPLGRNLDLSIRTNGICTTQPGEWDAETSIGFWDTNGSINLGQMIRSCDSQQKREPAE